MKSPIEWFEELGVPFDGDITIQDIIRIQEDAHHPTTKGNEVSDHPDPIEELRKWTSNIAPGRLIQDAIAAYDAKCAEVERLTKELQVVAIERNVATTSLDTERAALKQARADIQQLETGKYGRRELHAIIDKLTPELEAIKAELKQAHEDRIKAQDALWVERAKSAELREALEAIEKHKHLHIYSCACGLLTRRALSTDAGTLFLQRLREAEAKVEQLKAAFEEGRSRVYANFAHVPTALRAADWMWISFSKALTPPTIE